jgi:hypothetical protein
VCVPIPYGKRYTANLTGATLKPVRCEKCYVEYVYRMDRAGSGSGTSLLFLENQGARDRATQRAASELRGLLRWDCDAVPCPRLRLVSGSDGPGDAARSLAVDAKHGVGFPCRLHDLAHHRLRGMAVMRPESEIFVGRSSRSVPKPPLQKLSRSPDIHLRFSLVVSLPSAHSCLSCCPCVATD